MKRTFMYFSILVLTMTALLSARQYSTDIKIDPDEDRVLGFIASTGERDLLLVETSRGAEQTISTAKYDVTGRGGRGRELLQRGQFARVIVPLPDIPALPE